ncbi:MAG: hypothetical protein R3C52_09850 [Hyphomonadaceae bacterium]
MSPPVRRLFRFEPRAWRLAAAVAALSVLAPIAAPVLAPPAAAQIEAKPLSEVDPWGIGWMGQSDGAPLSLWSNTDTEALAPLFAAVKPETLSPAGRALLGRLLMSSTRAPAGDLDLTPERLRLLAALGEGERAASLGARFGARDWGMAASRDQAALELADGRAQSACGRAAAQPASDPLWMPVRALCLALAGDHDAAGMMSEQAVIAEALSAEDGAWLISAIETMRSPMKSRPDGRYATALDAAASIAAGLPARKGAFDAAPPDVALAVLRHPGSTPEQKRAALPRAAMARGASPDEIMQALRPAEDEKTAPGSIGAALKLAGASETPGVDKASAYADVLGKTGGADEFRLAALALLAPVKALSESDSRPWAETFTRMALAAGDLDLARAMRLRMNPKAGPDADADAQADGSDAAPDPGPDPGPDPWVVARIDLMLALAAGDDAAAEAALQYLVSGEPEAPPSARRLTSEQQAALAKRAETDRILALAAGAGVKLAPAMRARIADMRSRGDPVPDAQMAAIGASVDAGAMGEAAMRAVSLLEPDPAEMSFLGLAELMSHLRRAGFDGDARALTLEALAPSKRF